MYLQRLALFCMLLIGALVSGCSGSGDDTNPTQPSGDTEVVTCTSSINGTTVHDGSKLITATLQRSTSPQIKDGFIIMGYATTDISPKTRIDDGVIISLRPTGVGTYPVTYLLGATFGVYHSGVAYTSVQGTITVTRYDAVGGWVEGTFEGTANSQDGRQTITVTKGTFKVKRDADGLLG